MITEKTKITSFVDFAKYIADNDAIPQSIRNSLASYGQNYKYLYHVINHCNNHTVNLFLHGGYSAIPTLLKDYFRQPDRFSTVADSPTKIKAIEDNWWLAREYFRFTSWEPEATRYVPIFFGNEDSDDLHLEPDFFQIEDSSEYDRTSRTAINDRIKTIRFIHVSHDNPQYVSYTPSVEFGAQDRQLRTTLGRYLTKHKPNALDQNQLNQLSAQFKASFSHCEIFWATTPDEIEHVYRTGPHSCMSYAADHNGFGSFVHPTAAYANTPDIAVAYIKNKANKVSARTVVNKVTNEFIRIYGDRTLQLRLSMMGYRPGNLYKARLRAIPAHNPYTHEALTRTYVAPYLDPGFPTEVNRNNPEIEESAPYWLTPTGDGKHLIATYGNHEPDENLRKHIKKYGLFLGQTTTGLVGNRDGYTRDNDEEYGGEDRMTCFVCGDSFREDDMTFISYHDDYACGDCCDSEIVEAITNFRDSPATGNPVPVYDRVLCDETFEVRDQNSDHYAEYMTQNCVAVNPFVLAVCNTKGRAPSTQYGVIEEQNMVHVHMDECGYLNMPCFSPSDISRNIGARQTTVPNHVPVNEELCAEDHEGEYHFDSLCIDYRTENEDRVFGAPAQKLTGFDYVQHLYVKDDGLFFREDTVSRAEARAAYIHILLASPPEQLNILVGPHAEIIRNRRGKTHLLYGEPNETNHATAPTRTKLSAAEEEAFEKESSEEERATYVLQERATHNVKRIFDRAFRESAAATACPTPVNSPVLETAA